MHPDLWRQPVEMTQTCYMAHSAWWHQPIEMTQTCQLMQWPKPVNWRNDPNLSTDAMTQTCQLMQWPKPVNWCNDPNLSTDASASSLMRQPVAMT